MALTLNQFLENAETFFTGSTAAKTELTTAQAKVVKLEADLAAALATGQSAQAEVTTLKANLATVTAERDAAAGKVAKEVAAQVPAAAAAVAAQAGITAVPGITSAPAAKTVDELWAEYAAIKEPAAQRNFYLTKILPIEKPEAPSR